MSYPRFISRLCKHEQDAYETKVAAAEFYRLNRVPEQIERALNELFLHKPADLHGYLANYFTNLSTPPRINRLKGREVYDTRGQLSIEVEVFCIVRNMEKSMCSAAVSSHFGPEETSEDWKAKCQERADHVMTAVQWVNEPFNNMLQGQNPCDQSEVDQALSNFFMARYLEEKEIRDREKEMIPSPSESEVVLPSETPSKTKDKKSPDKGKKNSAEKPFPPAEPPEPVLPGSMAIGSVSLAVARTGAQLQGIPLYKYIAALKARETPAQFHIPIALVTLLSCGKASPGKLSLLEEVILIPKAGQRVKQVVQSILHDSGAPGVSFERPEQPLDLITEACASLGLKLGTEIHLAVNCAARELIDYSKGRYEISTGVLKSPDELVDVYQSLNKKYPAVVAFINPFRTEDKEQWEKLNNLIGDTCALLLDISNESKAPPPPGVSGRILKHVHETTVSDLICIASERQGSVLMGTTCNEPCTYDSLSDIAVGLGLDYVKLGGLSGAERMTKYNRLVCIEEELDQQGILVSKEKHPPPLFAGKPQKESTAAGRALSEEA
ncbi:enolase 4 isoform X2 [Hippoglossus hippoglossus]|uniref:enolase 4 isoform X2 n=1 Tax=Hippoglossus hippoglossus TaxID=8267 RepID=UPI00148E8DD8|nr:enolase 4 isoform X2 [Hippoglossus hippoglossus]XP_035027683.1 enolase 4 isoform X2 [Hippoglossus stenolepis]